MKVENQITETALAGRINEQHQLAFGKAREALEHARQAGLLLLEAKATVEHGQWLPWLEANIKFSARTAQRYIALAENWDRIAAKNDTVSHLTLRAALQAIAGPPSKVAAEQALTEVSLTFSRDSRELLERQFSYLMSLPFGELIEFLTASLKAQGVKPPRAWLTGDMKKIRMRFEREIERQWKSCQRRALTCVKSNT